LSGKKAKGLRAKTRDKFKRKGKITVNQLLQELKSGQTVNIKINSSFHSGIPHHRYHGATAKVIGRKGNAFVVGLRVGKTSRQLVVSPAHLHAVGSERK